MNLAVTASLSPGYQALFQLPVVAAELREPADPATLWPEEALQVARAVATRRTEFAGGRLCARRALAQLGIGPVAIGVAPDRQPLWPAGVVGSITHTRGLCAAVVALRHAVRAIGIDSEVVAPVSAGVHARICQAAEVEWVEALPAAERVAALMLIFSAKEAFYKCQYPLVGEWLDFRDLSIEPEAWLSPGDAQVPQPFRIRTTRPLAVAEVVQTPTRGWYRFHDGYVSAGVAIAAPTIATAAVDAPVGAAVGISTPSRRETP